MSKFQLQSVEKFIKKELIHKYHMPEIKKALMEKDWPEYIIEEAIFNACNNYKNKTNRYQTPYQVKNSDNNRTFKNIPKKIKENKISTEEIITHENSLSSLEKFIMQEYYRNTSKLLLYNTFIRKKWPQYVIEQAFTNVEKHIRLTRNNLSKQKYSEIMVHGLHSIKNTSKNAFVKELQSRSYPVKIIKIIIIDLLQLNQLIKKEILIPKQSLQIKKAAIETLNEKYNPIIIKAALNINKVPKKIVNYYFQEE